MNKITITPLGTISPYCTKEMNCPGFLIEYEDKKILLDCGNGITRMLKFPQILEDLNIFITHYHTDHYGDIGSLQYASYTYHNLSLLNNKIKIYLPNKDYLYRKKAIISNQETYSDYYLIQDNQQYKIGNMTITTKDNHSHTIESFMIKLQNKDFKIIYTSDIGTTNINELINFCRNSDLIICESSLLTKHNSKSNTHLTASNAATIAKLANAKKLLLTHFWPEENKNEYLEEALQIFQNAEVAQEGKKLILQKYLKR